MSRARTVLVGKNDVFLDSVLDWVARDGVLDVVGVVHSGAQAVERVETPGVDLVLIDVALPDMSGFEAARRIKSRPDAPLVVLLSFHDSQAARHEAWAAGADGFVPKLETTTALTPLLQELLRQRLSRPRGQASVLSSPQVPPVDPSE